GIARERQLTYAVAATLVGALLVVVAGAAARTASGSVPDAAAADGGRWIIETILNSRLKVALFAATLAALLPVTAYLPISDSTRGILSGLPLVPFGGLVAIAGDGSMSADARLAIIDGMAHGVWLGPAVAIWFIFCFSRYLSARTKMKSPAADAAVRFGAL